MSNLWDRPPRPAQGDANDGILFEWVGRVMSQWEHVEWQLSLLYAVVAGNPNGDSEIQQYGNGTIFKERLRNLRQKAAQYFIQKCDQTLEAEFDEICTWAEGFADRRNDVAHAVVFPAAFLPFFKDPPGTKTWILMPPYYLGRRYQHTGFAEFFYSSQELNRLILTLGYLHNRIGALRETLEG